MLSVATIAFVFTATAPVAATPPAKGVAGGATYEVGDRQCALYFDPKSAPTPDTEPYRGEHMLKPIDATGAPIENRVMRFPPGFPIEAVQSGFRVSAKGEIEVNPAGEVVRVQLTSPEDARFAAHAVGAIAFWRYRPVASGTLCRKMPFTIEWKVD
jgi:outer membrane biosynthesis protein TonB